MQCPHCHGNFHWILEKILVSFFCLSFFFKSMFLPFESDLEDALFNYPILQIQNHCRFLPTQPTFLVFIIPLHPPPSHTPHLQSLPHFSPNALLFSVCALYFKPAKLYDCHLASNCETRNKMNNLHFKRVLNLDRKKKEFNSKKRKSFLNFSSGPIKLRQLTQKKKTS